MKNFKLTNYKFAVGLGIFLVCFSMFTTNSFANEIILSHIPPLYVNNDRQTPISLTIISRYELIEKASLYYRRIGDPTFLQIDIDRSEIFSNVLAFNLPPVDEISSGYEYYFVIETAERTTTFPTRNPQTNPIRVRSKSPSVSFDQNFILMNDETVLQPNQDLIFAVSLFPIVKEVDFSSLRLFLNGVDVTRYASVSPPLVVYKRDKPSSGNYNFYVRAIKKNGQTIESPVWQYQVLEKESFTRNFPFDMSGNASLTTNLRDISGSEESVFSRTSRNDANFRLNFNTRRNWFLMRSRLYLTSYESSSKQPQNRYSFQFSIPHVDIHLLDYSPDYGSFLLSNKNLRGIAGRLYTAGLSLSAVYGQSARALDGKEIVVTETPTMDFDDHITYSKGTFQRNTTGIKLDIGEREGLRIGFGFVKVKDDLDSLEEKYYRIVNQHEENDLTFLTSPRDNLVLGFDTRLSLDNQRFIVGTEVAASIYNSNIHEGAMSKEELEDYLEGESLPFDPESLDKLIIINQNVEPIIPGRDNLAFQVYLRWFLLNNMLNISYSEIGASFRSLGSPYTQNDARVFTVSDYINLLNNRLSIDAGVNIVTDNLSEQKSTTTTNTNWHIQSMFRPAANFPYFRSGANFSTSSNDLEPMEHDDYYESYFLKLDQEMQAYNFGIGYRFEHFPHTVTSVDLSYDISEDKDLTEARVFDISRDSYRISILNSLRGVPLTTRFRLSTSRHKENSQPESATKNFSTFGLKNEYIFWNGFLTPYLDISLHTFGEHNNTLSRYDLGFNMRPYAQTSINTRIELASFKDKEFDDRDYNTFGWHLNINKRF